MTRVVEPSIFIIFGGTGDLARRKLLPALARLHASHQLHPKSHVVAVAIEPEYDSAKYRQLAHEAVVKAGGAEEAAAAFASEQLHYHCIGDGGPAEFAALAHMLRSIERANGIAENRTFYLALPPQVFRSTIDALGAAGLNKSSGWTRVVVEKPFGHDLESARALNQDIHRWYDESQVYRIDHYLGKDTVQNLLVLRFANTIFESVWTRDRIESVQITVAEDLGVGTRAGYYDKAGAFRDMVQNHLTQLLTLVAMEVPSRYEAEAIRFEKIKVLRSMRALDPNAVVRGQYTAGEIGGERVPGYLEEPGIRAGSDTETFIAMTAFVDNWRWAGVPFYLRTGKRMGKTLSQIAVRLRSTPSHLFASLGQDDETADVLIITIQPDAGFSLHFDVKIPGTPFRMNRIPLGFRYAKHFVHLPEAYETLLLDVVQGDQTLFVHADEVEMSWSFYAPLLVAPQRVYPYPAGSWGPPQAAGLAIPETELWQETWEGREK